MTRLLLALFFVGLAIPTALDARPRTQIVKYYAGTGFFVNKDGYIVTNNHVVEGCKDINVSGAIQPVSATLVATDPDNDLALLQVTTTPPGIANLRSDYYPLVRGEPVLTVGFPGKLGLTTREAMIIDTKGPRREDTLVMFSDSVQQGNSGGPLLDTSVNVVGVVVAKAEIFQMRNGRDRDVLQKADVAIHPKVLREFLDDHRIRYQERLPSGLLSAHRVEYRAEEFVVHVRCRQ